MTSICIQSVQHPKCPPSICFCNEWTWKCYRTFFIRPLDQLINFIVVAIGYERVTTTVGVGIFSDLFFDVAVTVNNVFYKTYSALDIPFYVSKPYQFGEDGVTYERIGLTSGVAVKMSGCKSHIAFSSVS